MMLGDLKEKLNVNMMSDKQRSLEHVCLESVLKQNTNIKQIIFVLVAF